MKGCTITQQVRRTFRTRARQRFIGSALTGDAPSGNVMDFPKTDREFFIWGNSSVCTNYVGLNQIVFRNYAFLQYSLCGVTIAFEYRGKL